MGDIEPASYAFILFFLYCILASIAAFQIARIVCYGHNLWGWQFGFLVQCVPFSILRAIFFLLIDVLELSNIALTFTIYWIPINLQFSTFSLLILFYAHIYYKTEKQWESRRLPFTLIFATTNLAYLVVTIVAVSLVATEGTQGDWENKMWNIVSAIGFFMLVFVLAYYGLRVASLMREGKAQISFQPKKSSNVQVVSVTAVIFLLFTTRAIFNVLSAVDTIGFTVESGLELNDLGMFALFFVWEIVPTSLVIILFWRIPSPRRQQALLPNAQAVPFLVSAVNESSEDRAAYSTDTTVRTSLFDNPQRYDSDEDGLNYSASPRFFLPANSPYSPYDTNPTPPSYGVLSRGGDSELSSS